MQENPILASLFSNYRNLDSRTERLKTALRSSILSFNLGEGVDFSVIEDLENPQDFSVTFTLSYRNKLYAIGCMRVQNFDALGMQPMMTFSNNFLQQMVQQRKFFDDQSIVINSSSAEETTLKFLQRHRKVNPLTIAPLANINYKNIKDVIDKFLKDVLCSEGTNNALNNCLAEYPKPNTWPLYALSGSAIVFLAMGITGAVFVDIIGNMADKFELINLFMLADFGTVIGLFVTVACLVWIGFEANYVSRFNSEKGSVIRR